MSVRAFGAVAAVVLFVTVLTGPFFGIDVTAEPPSLGDGTASVSVAEPRVDTLRITDGRFGTDVSYLRIPDLVADVDRVDSAPRIVYEVTVPAIGVERRAFQIVERPGRVRLDIEDVELSRSVEGPYRGYVAVRVQSFETNTVVMNRSVEVATP